MTAEELDPLNMKTRRMTVDDTTGVYYLWDDDEWELDDPKIYAMGSKGMITAIQNGELDAYLDQLARSRRKAPKAPPSRA